MNKKRFNAKDKKIRCTVECRNSLALPGTQIKAPWKAERKVDQIHQQSS